jgi:hypothetical protein
MGQAYWLRRQRAALGMAQSADAAGTRLIHYELAGRYSIMAAQSAAALGLKQVTVGRSSASPAYQKASQ